jgi:hypothetical protein
MWDDRRQVFNDLANNEPAILRKKQLPNSFKRNAIKYILKWKHSIT